MRIISGSLKGKLIKFVKNSKTRPLKDSVRENIFNILKHSTLIKTKIENSKILDLYSGIGSFGIESLSRNAESVTFVEHDKLALGILKDNLIALSIIDKTKIYNGKIEVILKNLKQKFDIFFFDPPFNDLTFLKNIKLIKKQKIFEINHIVIIHRKKGVEDSFENLIKIIKTKTYGKSKVIFGVFE